MDAEALEYMRYDRPEYGLVAAFLYGDPIIGSGADYNQVHILEGLNGEVVEYIIADDDMEGLALDAEIKRQNRLYGLDGLNNLLLRS